MNTSAIEAAGLKPLQPELDRIAALKDKPGYTRSWRTIQLINVDCFLQLRRAAGLQRRHQADRRVDQGGLGLPEKDYYLRTGDEDEKTRQQYVPTSPRCSPCRRRRAAATADAQNIMQLETALAKASLGVPRHARPGETTTSCPLPHLARAPAGHRVPGFLCRYRRTSPSDQLNSHPRLLHWPAR